MNPKIRSVITFLTANLHRPISMAEVALLAGLSYSRIYDLFKAELGIPPMQYHKSLRMEKARQLLEDSAMKIKQVLLEIGYHDQRHFFRDFKEHFGLTPSQYRQRHAAAILTAGASQKKTVELTTES